VRGCIAGITNLMPGEVQAIADVGVVQLRDQRMVLAIWAHDGSFRS
jgi:hypothetical protein